YQAAPIGLALLDRELRHVRINQQLASINGLPVAEHLGRSIWEVLPDMAPLIAPLCQKVISSGVPIVDQEVRGRTAADSGSEHVYVVSFYPVLDSGSVSGITAVVQDITVQKRTEEALRRSEHQFALFMQHLPGAAWIKDLEGRYVYANPEGERIFQKRLGELAGKTDDEVFPPETAAQFRANDQLAITTGQGLQTIEMLPQPDGIHYSIVSKFPLYGDSDKPVLVGGVAFDITEQRNAEEALRRTAQELFASNKELRRSNEELRATREQLQLITNNMAASVGQALIFGNVSL